MPSELAQKFVDWAREYSGLNERALLLVSQYADNAPGRELIAQAYVTTSHQRMYRAVSERWGSPEKARQVCLSLETFIQLFPKPERFCSPLISIREDLIELYAFLSPKYESTQGEAVDTNSTLLFQEALIEQFPDSPRRNRYEREPVV